MAKTTMLRPEPIQRAQCRTPKADPEQILAKRCTWMTWSRKRIQIRTRKFEWKK